MLALPCLVAFLVLVVAGCNSPAATATPVSLATAVATSSAGPTPSDTGSAAPSDASPAPPVPDSPIAGIVVAVDSAGLDQVKGFTLRTNDGVTIVFTIGILENGDEFPPGHLKEHQATATPILAFFRETNGQLVVYRIEDAG